MEGSSAEFDATGGARAILEFYFTFTSTAVPLTDTTYSITDLAREFGLTTRAIRFYEDHGLLAPMRVGRTRVYGYRDRVRLRLTVRGKRLGFSLVQIRESIDMYDSTGDDKTQLERFLHVLENRRSILQQQREEIEAVLGEIDAFERQCRDLLTRKKEKARPAGTRSQVLS